MLPEAGNTCRSLYGFAAEFARNGYDALALDLRGYGVKAQGSAGHVPPVTLGYLESYDLERCIDDLGDRYGSNGLILYGQGAGAAAAALYAERAGDGQIEALLLDGMFASTAELDGIALTAFFADGAAGEAAAGAPAGAAKPGGTGTSADAAKPGGTGASAAAPASGEIKARAGTSAAAPAEANASVGAIASEAGFAIPSEFELQCARTYIEDVYGFGVEDMRRPLAEALAGVGAPTLFINSTALFAASAAEKKGGLEPAPGRRWAASAPDISCMKAIYSFIGLHEDFFVLDDPVDRSPSGPNMASGTPSLKIGDLVFEDSAFNNFYFVGTMADSYIGAVNGAIDSVREKFGGGIDVHLLLAPMPCEFYVPEPYWSEHNAPQEYALSYVKEHLDAGINMVDAYRLLKAHRDEYIYFRTDHHWSPLGAYYAYRAFMRSIGETPWELEEYKRVDSKQAYYGSRYNEATMAIMKNASDEFWYYGFDEPKYTYVAYGADGAPTMRGSIFNEPALNAAQKYYTFMGGDFPYAEIRREGQGGNGRRIAVIKDSYGNAFIPYLIPHFDSIYVIDPRHYSGDIYKLFRDEGVTDLLFMNYTLVLGLPNYSEKINQLFM
jgi:pimeloyl-ACP methyl ester carboxylesterase